ncbi:PREDICTED: auxilin-related protein 2 [Populus euphratica]|uniref:Auxilin-related protein 2 n=1 Tax=Populus euphratica TaxID=75702 RepID=A0AAJ6UDN7_POPEU|nr:PREDICTED: auxilin-related protein 2 [Populus euphratica]
MDEFGVLTERFGLKPQGKSAPMAASRGSNNTQIPNFASSNPKTSSYSSKSTYNSHSFNGSFMDDHETLRSNSKSQNFGDDFDIFGGFQKNSKQTSTGFGFDYDSLFPSTKNSSAKSSFYDDIFGGLNVSSSTVNNNNDDDDIFGAFTSYSSKAAKQRAPVDDLLGGFGTKLKPPSRNGSVGYDDLIPGFGSRKSSSKEENIRTTTPAFTSTEDPFVVLEQTSTKTKLSTDPLEEFGKFNHSGRAESTVLSNRSPPLRPPPKPGQVLKTGKSSDVSAIDELEDFAMGRMQTNAHSGSNGRHAREVKESADDLELFFGRGSRSSSVPKSRPEVPDPLFDAKINAKGKPEFPTKKSSTSSPGIRKTSAKNVIGDLSSIFGDAMLSGEFEEVDGESEERRRARWDRHQRTRDRIEQAVADMNQRDRQTLHEQEERRRIADKMDVQIKHWAAGKEGNMRALLSSLQYVLWPDCDWEPVALTDLITSTSVKKVYRKATLCVHPDKVQQKGATIQQKYIAEKVFDTLKEAWNKFSKEELS